MNTISPNLIGNKYGKLMVIGLPVTKEYPNGKKRKYKKLVLCVCNCGNPKYMTLDSLLYKGTKSCGCLTKEVAANLSKTHGLSKTVEYATWINMIRRCTKPYNHEYPEYGGRGIRVCDRWLSSFENFLYDMGKRPSALYSLDRFPNNNGNYEPENCRWATFEEQNNNRRNTVWILYNGEQKPISKLCNELKIDISLVRKRIYAGWSIERAVETPSKFKEKIKK